MSDFDNEFDNFETEGHEEYVSTSIPIVKASWEGITKEKRRDGLIYTFDINNKSICGAKNRKGEPCKNSPIRGRNRCKFHGGSSPRGLAHPRTKHMKYSRDIVSRELAERYEQASNDESLLELRDEIALIQARIADMLKNVESGDTQKSWVELQKAYDDFAQANRSNNPELAAKSINKIGRIITKGVSQHQSWRELMSTMNVEKKLIESERKRLQEMKQMMTAEQAMGMLTFVVSVFKKRTYEIISGDDSKRLLAAVSQDISEYISSAPHMRNSRDE
jgi:hypothetical protein